MKDKKINKICVYTSGIVLYAHEKINKKLHTFYYN